MPAKQAKANFSFLLLLSGLALALLSLVACNDPKAPVPEGDEPLPKLYDLYPTTKQAPQRVPAQVMVHRAEVAYSADVNPAWQLVTTHGIDPRDVTTWQANGFRIGTLRGKDLATFFALLPPRDHDDRTVWMTIPTDKEMDPEPLIIADGESPQREVTLFLPPDTLRTVKLPRGRYQFLMTARELSQTPGTSLNLTPHLHYKDLAYKVIPHPEHKNELVFRTKSPAERRLDGRIFNNLELNTVITPGHYFVVAIDIPVKLPTRPKTVPATPPAPTTTAPSDQTDSTTANDKPEQELVLPLSVPDASSQFEEQIDPHLGLAKKLEIEWKLGDLTLGLERFGTPYQAVLIFESVPSQDPLPK